LSGHRRETVVSCTAVIAFGELPVGEHPGTASRIQQPASANEFEHSRRRMREARARFYVAIRADLGVTSGDIPAELGTRLSSAP
jgi:hypothetical protein